MTTQTLYEEFKNKLPEGLTAEAINSMPRELVENLADEYSSTHGIREDEVVEPEPLVVEEKPVITVGKKEVKVTTPTNSLEEFLNDNPDNSEELLTVKPVPQVTKDSKPKELNLGKLNVVNVSTMDAQSSYERFLNKRIRSTYMVVLPVSGYTAHMRGLDIEEIDAIRNSFEDHAELKSKLKEMTFRCIQKSSVNFKNYEEFLQNTAMTELDILMFGIMVKTFGSINKFRYKCKHCGTENTVNIDLNSIVRIDNDAAFDQVDNIQKAEDPLVPYNDAPVRKTNRILLPDTQLVIDIKLPSLDKDDAIAKYFREKGKEAETSRLYSYMLITNDLFLPYFQNDEDVEPYGYTQISLPVDKYKYLKNLSKKDRDALEEKLNELYQYNVEFKAEGLICSNSKCKKENSIGFKIFENFIRSILADA